MKKIRDFLLGSNEEKEAQARSKELDGRDPARMSYAERIQQAEAGNTVFRLRIRQGLSALAAVGLAWGTWEASEGFRSDKPEPAPIVENASEVREVVMEFTLGNLTFVKEAQLPSQEFERIKTLLSNSYEFLAQHLPVDEVKAKKITVRSSGKPTFSQASYMHGDLQVGPKASDGIVVHEFVHLLHGDLDLNNDLIEEGIATALSILAAEKLGMESWDRTASLQLNDNLENALPLRPNIRYTVNPVLLKIRYEKAAYFWIDLEQKSPGFIKKFHEAYYAFLLNGGKKEDLFKTEVIKQVLTEAGLWQKYTEAMKEHRVAQAEEAEKVDEDPKLFAYYVHYSNDNTRKLIVTVAKRTTDGIERGLQQIQAQFEITNLDTGKKSGLLGTEPAEGQVTINLTSGEKGASPLIDWVGPGKRYRVELSVPTPNGSALTDTFEFNYE
ncbi:MAG: hypothetical protein WC897_00160 [Candidatus Gracilibacteria bacterium]